jgi:hypothetical protein
MSNGKTAKLVQDQLNHALPIFRDSKFGDLIVAVLAAINGLVAAGSSSVLNSAGLAIKAGGSALAKTANLVLVNINGVYLRKAPADLPALVGNLATAKSAAWPFYIDAAGTFHTGAKTADVATHDLALAAVPAVPAGYAQLGILVLDNATGANFVGGTTALDAASLTATYYNAVGAMPSATASVRDLVTF